MIDFEVDNLSFCFILLFLLLLWLQTEMERQSARLLSTEKSLRDVQLHCQKLNSVEQKYNELYVF